MRLLAIALVLASSGCSLRTIALRNVADALSASGEVFARDDDPELIRESVPIVIKTMEDILEGVPTHKQLLLALARTLTQYGAAFVVDEADRLEEKDVRQARLVYARARRLFLRGRDYGARGLDRAVPGLERALRAGSRAETALLLKKVKKPDVALLFWTGAAWASAVAAAKNDLALVGQLPLVELLMRRALELEEGFDEGALHEFFIAYASAQAGSADGGPRAAKSHLDRALVLSHNKRLSVLVTYAESVCVASQDKAEFERLLGRVLAFDPDSDPDHRLANILAQRRARWLLSRTSELFAD